MSMIYKTILLLDESEQLELLIPENIMFERLHPSDLLVKKPIR